MIEIETKYTDDIYKKFYWFSILSGKYHRFKKAILPFIFIFLITTAIVSFSMQDNKFTFIVAMIGVSACALFYILAFFAPRYYIKRSQVLFNSDIRFVFEEESFTETQSGEISGDAVIQYTSIYKASETQDMFYIYLTPSQAFMIPKHDFIKGTAEQLASLLQAKLPSKKYIICK